MTLSSGPVVCTPTQWWFTESALKRAAESGIGCVSDGPPDLAHRVGGGAQQMCGTVEAPLADIGGGRLTQ